jgi:hypothetical protein
MIFAFILFPFIVLALFDFSLLKTLGRSAVH